jgi:hypothetical protein
MFGHQNDQPKDDSTQTTDQVANNDVTPPSSFIPPQDNSAPDIPAVTDEPATDTTSTSPASSADEEPVPGVHTNDLLDIKQQALNQLSPLVGHLEQTPEEKFRTTMMMIQASDNQSLIKDAYEAAQNISDEKIKAQALLDIVNEINYFTQHHAS